MVAGMLGGALNSVAGGGSFITFPTLLFTGVPPIPANATNTVALWSGVTASTGAYRSKLDVPHRVLIPLLCASVAGGLGGAYLLLRTPAHTFMRLLPWLMMAATLLFIFGRRLAPRRSGVGHDAATPAIVVATLCQFCIGTYGGYFGGGVGIVILAMLSAIGMTEIHSMNALKSALSSTINGLAALAFVAARVIYWKQAVVMLLGAIVGGYFGARYAQRVPQPWIRALVILAGTIMTVYFFAKAY